MGRVSATGGETAEASDNELAFEAFGVKVSLGTNRPDLLERLRALVPPGAVACPPSEAGRRFRLDADDAGRCTVSFGEGKESVARGLELELAVGILDAQVRVYLGSKAGEVVFVHAGVVAHEGVAIALPGKSFAGKTMLVAALVEAGATYYSDEFAVIDEQARVHPYAKPLSVRGGEEQLQTDHALESLGWTPGAEPLPLALIAVTTYRPGAEWRPRRMSPGEGAMALLANAVPAQLRPGQVMRFVSQAASNAVAIESPRGEAADVAPLILAEVERLTA